MTDDDFIDSFLQPTVVDNKKGRARGEDVGTAVLTAAQVSHIRNIWAMCEREGTRCTKASLARRFGVSPTTIADILNVETWQSGYTRRPKPAKPAKPIPLWATADAEGAARWAELQDQKAR